MSASLKELVTALTPAQQTKWFGKLSPAMQKSLVLRKAWWFEARPEQQTPPGEWRFWLVLAGRGWGKSRTGAEWSAEKARRYPGARIALIGPTFADGRDTMVEGESGLLSVLHDSELRGGSQDSAWNRSMGELFLENGSRFKIFSSERPRRLRGPQHHFAWCVPGDTLIETETGRKPIRDIGVGERVWTRSGLRTVTWSGLTRHDALLVKVTTATGEVLNATSDHEVWVDGHGWKPLGDVAPGDTMLAWSNQSQDRQPGTYGMTPGGIETERVTTKTALEPCFTSQCGNGLTGCRCQTGMSSTTATTTGPTTTSATLNASPKMSTTPATPPREPHTQSGSQPKAARRGDRTPSPCGPTGKLAPSFATGAESPINQPECAPGSVTKPALRGTAVVSVEKGQSSADVYDLTVNGEHEFFAAGLLVHNCDEPAYWDDVEARTAKDSTFSNMNIGLRLPPLVGWDAQYRPQGVLTTTPRRVPLIKMPDEVVAERPALAGLVQRKDVLITRGSTMDNIDNLDESYKATVIDPLVGTALGQQELDGILLEEVEGALWNQTQITGDRVEKAPRLDSVVVAYDPSGGSGYGHDEHGIMVIGSAGRREEAQFYLLADRSKNCTPNDAARLAIFAYLEFGAAAIVYEKNQGQDWIPAVFKAEWDNLTTSRDGKPVDLPEYAGAPAPRMKAVTAVKNKRERATPTAMLSQQHRTHMVGLYPILENQLTSWVPDEGLASPDRLDAYVWGHTWLTENGATGADVASPAAREARRGGRRPGQPSSRLPAAYGTRRMTR